MRRCLLIPVLFTVTCFLQLLRDVESNPILRNPLTYVGNADNTAYFVMNSTRVNWNEANQLCQAVGMELATVKTNNQRALLGATIPRRHDNFFWSAATDSRDLTLLKWPDNSHPRSDLFGAYIRPSIPKICGLIYFVNPTTSVMDLIPCSDLQRPMCQISLGSIISSTA